MRGLRGFDGPCVTTRSRATTRPLRRGGLPPSLAPLGHNPLTFTYRQPPEPFRPASRPPPLMGRLPSRASPAQKKAPLSKGAGRVSGLGDSDGPCRIARYTRRRPGIPPPRLRSAPPFDKGGFPRGLRPRKKAPLTGELAEPARPEGFRRALRGHPSTGNCPPTAKGRAVALPCPSRAQRFTAARRGRACPARDFAMPPVNGLNPSGLLRGHLP